MNIDSIISRAQHAHANLMATVSEDSVLSTVSAARYMDELDRSESLGGYYYTSEKTQKIGAQIVEKYGEEGLELFHRLILLNFIIEFPSRRNFITLSEDNINELTEFFSIVIGEVESNKSNYFKYGKDRFAKALAVCRLKMIPCGSMLIDIKHGGIPRANLLLPPRTHLLNRLKFFLIKVGSFRNLLELHMDFRLTKHFNEEGVIRTYLKAAELLEDHPEKNGIIASGSWLLDPELKRVSPELCYIREIPEKNGALLVPSVCTEKSKQDAFRFSPKRQALFTSGEYDPQCYSQVWQRDDLIRWARSQR